MTELITIIASCFTTASIILSAIVCILQSFYFSRKEANQLKEDLNSKLIEITAKFDGKLEKHKQEFKKDLNSDHDDVKKEIEKLSDKIDDMATKFITVPTFQTYTESINKLLEMYSDRTERIEISIDNVREELSILIKELKK